MKLFLRKIYFRSSGGISIGRSGDLSLELPITGQLTPLDIYKALMMKVRSENPPTAQAFTQKSSGELKEIYAYYY